MDIMRIFEDLIKCKDCANNINNKGELMELVLKIRKEWF